MSHKAPDFDELKCSTKTIMVYSNLTFDLDAVFRGAIIHHIENPPRTKKKKDVDKDKLAVMCPPETIIGVSKDKMRRGIDTRKKKKKWCAPNCRIMKTNGARQVKVNTVRETTRDLEEKCHPSASMYIVEYCCDVCNKTYTHNELGEKIPNFLNQVTIVISTGDYLLNVMLFRDNFKIAGCKTEDDAKMVTRVLWEEIRRIGAWKYKGRFTHDEVANAFEKRECELLTKYEGPDAKIKWRCRCGEITETYLGEKRAKCIGSSGKITCHKCSRRKADNAVPHTVATKPSFIFDTVMQNLDSHIPILIDRNRLNILMNKITYEKKPVTPSYKFFATNLRSSEFENSSRASVNIKVKADRPDDHLYDMMVWDDGWHDDHTPEISFRTNTKKKTKETTIIIFSPSKDKGDTTNGRSEIILSGPFKETMRKTYNGFVSCVMENEDDVIETF